MDALLTKFGDKMVSQNSKHCWPRGSVDFTVSNFSLFDYCRQEVYKIKPRNKNELKASIRALIEALAEAAVTTVKNTVLAAEQMQSCSLKTTFSYSILE